MNDIFNKMKALNLLAPFILFIFSYYCRAQQISGSIEDFKTGEPLAGASIVSNEGEGCISDAQGKFRLPIKGPYAVLTISFIGYKSLISDTIWRSEATSNLVFKLMPEAANLGEVVVSAGKFEQRLEEVTVSLDVLKPNLQEDKNQVKLESILQQAPGVNVVDGQANIRGGSGWSYGTGTRVQLLVDDLPLISGDAAQSQWDLVPLYSTERIEVVKGASSVLYGSAALNGVINVLTHPRPTKQALSIDLYSGFYDSPKRKSLKWWDGVQTNSGLNFDLQQPLSSNSGLLLSGGQIEDEGFRYLENEKRTSLFGKYFFTPDRLKGLELSLATSVNYTDQGDALLWENDSLAYIPSDSSITRSYGWDFYIEPRITYRHGQFKHTLQGRYLRLNNNAKSKEADYANSSNQFMEQYYLQYFYSNKLVLTAGFFTALTKSDAVVFVGKHSTANNAVFLQADYKPLKWLNLNGGVRYEDFYLDDRYYKKPVFRGGINAQIVKGTNARFSYGEAFRFPSVSEAFTSTSFGQLIVYPNPQLEPETGHSFEVGLRQMFYSKKIKGYADIAAFQMRYSNMIEYTFAGWGKAVPPTYGLGFKSLNIGETVIKGAELAIALEGHPATNLTYRILAGYTYILPQVADPHAAFAQDRNGNQLTYTLSSSDTTNRILKYRYQHLAKIDCQVEAKSIHGGFSIRYNDFMQNIDRLFNDQIAGVKTHRARNSKGDIVIDVRAGYSFNKHWQADILVNNLFNREVMIRPAYLAEPRNYALRVNYSL